MIPTRDSNNLLAGSAAAIILAEMSGPVIARRSGDRPFYRPMPRPISGTLNTIIADALAYLPV
jgi:hypothetical protein